MSKNLPAAWPFPAKATRRCPTCSGQLTAEGVCWHCCDRPCRGCGRNTGSAFIDICWPCWFREQGAEGGPPAAGDN